MGKGSLGRWMKGPLSSFCASLQKTSPVDGSTLGRARPRPRDGRFVSWALLTSWHQASPLFSAKWGGRQVKGPSKVLSA